MHRAARIRGNLVVSSIRTVIETLERRTLLHAAVFHELPPDLAALAGLDGHVAASDLLKARPKLAGKNLWDAATFNPRNSLNRNDWLYDPHFIEDDLNLLTQPPPTPAGGPEGQSLPDIVPLGPSAGYLVPFLDTTEIPGRNLLRFSTAVGNQGAGPAVLISANSGTPPAGSGLTSWINADGTQNVVQQVYQFGGTSFSFDHYRAAGRMVFHNGHGHFHLEGYAQYRLLQNVGGNPGPVVVRGDGTEAVGDKIGFCLINILSSFTLPGGGSSSTLPGFNAPGQPSTGCGFTQGIHVGKADVYDAIYDGQWIDVTGVPNGSYFIEVTMDALNVIEESNDANNTIVVPATLNASPPVGGIQPDRFEPNQTFATATDLGVLGNQTQSGLTIHYTDEPDYFRFVAASGGSYQVRLNIGDRDVNLYLYDSNQTLLASSTSPNSGGTETVTWNFVAGQTYYALAKGFGSNQGTSGVSSNYAIQFLINPTINASTPDPSANELGPDFGLISIARNGPVSSPLTVNFTVSGSATRGVDYQIYQSDVLIAGNSVTIGNEAATADLEIRPISDSDVETPETVTITLNNNAAYVIGAGTNGSVTIADTGPQVSQTSQVWQTSPHKVSFTFSRPLFGIDASDFAVLNLDTNQPVPLAGFDYNGGTNTATLTFNGVLPDGHFRATVVAGGFQDSVGNAMQANYLFNYFVLTGDANHDGRINLFDFDILASNFGLSGRDGSTGDFNFDGICNLADFDILASKFGVVIASPSSVRPGLFNSGTMIDQRTDRRIDELA